MNLNKVKPEQLDHLHLVYHFSLSLTFKGTNFHGYLISRLEKNCISRVLIFANDRLREDLRVLIFANLDFFFCSWLIASRCRLARFKVGLKFRVR